MLDYIDVDLELQTAFAYGRLLLIQVKGKVGHCLFALVNDVFVQEREGVDELELFHSDGVEMDPAQGPAIEILIIAHSAVQAVQLVKDPESHDHPAPQVAAVVVDIVDKTQTHVGVKVVVG